MPGTFSQLLVHIVFATKRRHPWITPPIAPRLHGYMGGIIREERGTPVEIGGVTDHVHLLIRWKMDGAISDLMRVVKARSSKWVHQTFSELTEFAWQEGYAAFSVSASQEDVVRQYIRNQEEHHARFDFKEELRRLLVAHRIEFDERYAFE